MADYCSDELAVMSRELQEIREQRDQAIRERKEAEAELREQLLAEQSRIGKLTRERDAVEDLLKAYGPQVIGPIAHTRLMAAVRGLPDEFAA